MNKKDKGMIADTTTLPKEDITGNLGNVNVPRKPKTEENKTDADHTQSTPIEIYKEMRPVTGKKSPQVQGFGKARKPIR